MCKRVALFRASLYAIWIIPKLVGLALVLQTGAAYVTIDLPSALWINGNVSFC